MVADASTLQLPWRTSQARRPSSAKFGHVTRGQGPPASPKRRPDSAPLRPSYEAPPANGVARKERTVHDDLPCEAVAVDVEASWPQSFVTAVNDEPVPTMGSSHSEHACFLRSGASGSPPS